MPTLFDTLQLGDLTLPNRVLMAPLTRLRGTPDHHPTSIIADYYAQRASAGLIISEGIPIDPMGVGYPQVPGLWSDEQAAEWKPITDAVHKAGGLIFAQIWHVGRMSDPVYLNGMLPIAPSALAQHGTISLVRPRRALKFPALSTSPKSPASSRPTVAARSTPRTQASTGSSFTGPTATCSTSSSNRTPTTALTRTGDRSKTVPAS